MAYLLTDDFLTDTSASYTKDGTWAYDATNKTLNSTNSITGFAVQNVSVSDNISAKGSVYITTNADGDANSYNGVSVGADIETGASHNGYSVVFRASDKSNIWLLDENVAWVTSGAFTWDINTKYWLRIYRNGTNVKCKVWADGSSEPGTWTIDTTVTSHMYTNVGFSSGKGAGSSSARFDDLYVWSGESEPSSTPKLSTPFLLNFL